MKVLHLNSEKSWRGGEQQLFYLLEELPKYGVGSLIACRPKTPIAWRAQERNWPYAALPFCNELDLYTAYRIKKLCSLHQIDLVHAHAAKAHSAAFLAGFFYSKPLPLVVSRRVDYALGRHWLSRAKYNTKAVKKIICVSRAVEGSLKPYISEPQKLVTIHSGIDLSRFQKKKEECNKLREEYKIPKDFMLIGNTAALSPQKDYFSFIDSAARIFQKEKRVHFFIIGEGKERVRIEKYIQAKQMQDHITLTGFRSDIEDILPELDLFLFTSLREALGTSILDAFAAGVPVVAANVGGISESITHAETGFLARAQDSELLAAHTLQLLRSPRLRKEIAKKAKQKLQDFTKEETARQSYELYADILAKDRS